MNSFFRLRRSVSALRVPIVIAFALVVFAGLEGNYYRSIAPVAAGVLWLVFISALVLLAGKFWCLLCPWDAVSEWVQRLSFGLVKNPPPLCLNLKWPRFLRNIYLPLAALMVLIWAEYSYNLTDNPRYVAYLSMALFSATFVSAMIFERKSFCRWGCPVGAMSGVFAAFGMLEVRSVDRSVCANCQTKDCIKGNEKGYGCPVFEYPGGMETNLNCTQCTECLKTCPYHNMKMRFRLPWREADSFPLFPADASFAVAVLLGLTTFAGWARTGIYERTLSGLIESGFPSGIVHIFLFAPVVFAVMALFYLSAVITGKGGIRIMAVAGLPILMFIHLGHISRHIISETGRLIPALSDPMGRGWDLFGTAGFVPVPLAADTVQFLFACAIIAIGAALAVRQAVVTGRAAGSPGRAAVAAAAFSIVIAAANALIIVFGPKI